MNSKNTLNHFENVNPASLIVPINLVAFCVGTIDAQGEKPSTAFFAGAATDYQTLNNQNTAFIGENVTRALTQAPLNPLQTGIHLHWALPDALTKADNKKGILEFPPAPNRWLVTRFNILSQSLGTPQIKSWVIESDVLTAVGQTPISLPVTPLTVGSQTYQALYLGRSQKLADWPSDDRCYDIKTYCGSELTAVSNGVSSFAAYYPDCQNVFGFYDPMDPSDDPSVTEQPLELMYVVIGWYSKSKK